ncbi:MAG TPA: phospholipase [Bacteroidetes bacterium]|nr:phospholipase [Bacteroidota bacterium]
MDLINTSLIHKIVPPSVASPGPYPTIILLHGRGTNEDDLLGLAPYLDPRFFLVSARAPFPFPYGGHAWYEMADVGTPVGSEFDESYRRLHQFIDDVLKGYPVDPGRIFLFGFSMGSIMSLAIGLTNPDLVRGVVAHSGYVPENTSLKFKWDELSDLSLFVAHGQYDPVIPIQFGRRISELLSKTQADFTYREYPIPHTISEESLTDVATWLKEKALAE